MDLGNIIKDGLYRKNMSQTDLAKKIGKHRQLVNDWIHNRKVPEFETLRKIALELDIVSQLFPEYNLEKKSPKESISLENRVNNIEEMMQQMISEMSRITGSQISLVGNKNVSVNGGSGDIVMSGKKTK